MYGNITSHLYVFKRGPSIIEIWRQLFKGQRTLWPGNTHHLARAVASEDKLVSLHGEVALARVGNSVRNSYRARTDGELTRCRPKLTLGPEPESGAGTSPMAAVHSPSHLHAKLGARGGSLPSAARSYVCIQGVNSSCYWRPTFPPEDHKPPVSPCSRRRQ